jgi:hypothetical protein
MVNVGIGTPSFKGKGLGVFLLIAEFVKGTASPRQKLEKGGEVQQQVNGHALIAGQGVKGRDIEKGPGTSSTESIQGCMPSSGGEDKAPNTSSFMQDETDSLVVQARSRAGGGGDPEGGRGSR